MIKDCDKTDGPDASKLKTGQKKQIGGRKWVDGSGQWINSDGS